MDTLRGNFADRADLIDDGDAYDPVEDDAGRETPSLIGQDERRMQVRAYNHWAGLLEDRNFPSIDDLDPESLTDFGPYSVLLDFTAGIENPGISYLGEKLAIECDADETIEHLDDVPSRSLLSRITDHYMQILANQAPIGFEAEFVNQRNQTILYRGILLPFSSDDDTIDFIYGVINWKELADQRTTDELMLEIDQALEDAPEETPLRSSDHPMTDWADGPAATVDLAAMPQATPADGILNLNIHAGIPALDDAALPMPHFGGPDSFDVTPASATTNAEEEDEDFSAYALSPMDESQMGLGDWLASARELAQVAVSSEDRSRAALYEAISRAYDFSLAAAAEPDEFADLLEASGLAMQERAPMTPVVKLVFGVDYDKTRLTEYAAALSHAHRHSLDRGALGDFLRAADGGLKGVVAAERRLRREESGKPSTPVTREPRARIARQLRKLQPMALETLAGEGHEFGLVMIRRMNTGEVAVLGEISEDVAMIEKAAKKLIG
ncbi:hypothetical protein SZ64_14125 [Erythrobacter sp. SG61-1L]|uniref:PAS domain-containing protein n=1 Tax=Erythrobacter sp. SG61-1L TaxID=1603897 RepID=UPI0006C92C70|nr:hypothetical protein [Erythrobacter sp. SG61-1L]KPL69144.1 hypothetical protein SZ64_14125 [Erythrobacter sp. SG61-1L]